MIDDIELARTLLEEGIANRDQLRQARQLQLTEGTTLYLALIEHEILDEALLVELVASILNLPFVTLQGRTIDPPIRDLVPLALCRTQGVLPLDLREDQDGDLLLLAMREPLDIMVMDDISALVNVGIQPILCGPRDLEDAIERSHRPPPPPAQQSFDIPRDNSVDFGAFSSQPAQSTSSQSPGDDERDEEDDDSLGSEDSWATFFDDALAAPDPSSGLEMRDRHSTMALDLMDIDEVLDAADVPSAKEDDPVSLLDVPGASSVADDDDLEGWEVDSAINKRPPPPPLPGDALKGSDEDDLPPIPAALTKESEGHIASQDAFDALYASIDSEDSPSIPDGTFIASPSVSVTGELVLDASAQSDLPSDEASGVVLKPRKKALAPPADEPELKEHEGSSTVVEESLFEAQQGVEGDGIQGEEEEGLGKQSGPSSAEEEGELEVSDEAGSQTQMGSLGQMLLSPSSSEGASKKVVRQQLSIDQERGTFTTLGTPKRLNPDGSKRPMLVIEESEGENLFAQAIAHVDAAESGQHPITQGPPQEGHAREGDEGAQREEQEQASAAALGRLKLKRVALSPASPLLGGPIVETSSRKKRGEEEQTQAEREGAAQSEASVGGESEPAVRDIFDDDDILAGFAAALDEEDPTIEGVSQQSEDAKESDNASGKDHMDATREFDVSSIFSLTSEDEESLNEATSAAMGEAHARIERLNDMIRHANQSAQAHGELGNQGTDGFADATTSTRARHKTMGNEALTQDAIDKMRHQSTMDLSSDLLFLGSNSPGLPGEVDDSRLLRAALMILISKDLIKIDELIALAKSLPPSDL